MYVMVSVPGFVCQYVHTHGMHDFIMDSLKKASLIRCHLSKVLKEEEAQALWILTYRKRFQVRYKDLDENLCFESRDQEKPW